MHTRTDTRARRFQSHRRRAPAALPTVPSAVAARYLPAALGCAALLLTAACEQPTEPTGSIEEPVVVYTHSPAADWSFGIYRIPYADGTTVDVWQDHHTHSPATDRTDLNAGTGATIVAAASGWIRFIQDRHGNTFNRGDGLAHDTATAQADSLEHGCLNRNPPDSLSPPNPIFGSCAQYNNYVWIEHPNREWTKYTHFGTGTVTIDNGWQPGDWVNAGEVLGLEDDIGAAGGSPSASHLHFEVARAIDPNATTLPLGSLKGAFIDTTAAVNLVPTNCDGAGGIFFYDVSDDGLTAGPCNHQPPVADAGGPYAADEGELLALDGTGSSDPDGRPLVYRWTPSTFLDDSTTAQPTFVAGDEGVYDVTLRVYDQVEALVDSASATITIGNVAPTVTIDPSQVTVIDEHGTITVTAGFTDPGFGDTHTASIDWGVPAGHQGVETVPPTIQVTDPGGPGVPLTGTVTATYRYGDNDDGTGFTIEVTVTDDDGGVGSDSFSLDVNNVAPAVSIDPSGSVLLNGVPTILGEAGADIDFAGFIEDPGSDDLTITWDWDDGSTDSRISLVDPPAADPLPSPTVQPRAEPEATTHTFAEACMYDVTLSADDDDSGSHSDAIVVAIVGTADVARGAGYWQSEYRFKKQPDFSPATLSCYLEIVNHASAVFGEARSLANFAEAVDVVWTRGTSEADDLFDRQIFTAWLNFANGAHGLDELFDTNGDGIADTTFANIMQQAESLRTDPTRTREQLLAMKDLLEGINGD